MITDRIGRHEVLLPINYNHYNFRENKGILICERAFNANYPKLWKISLAKTLLNVSVTNSSILENPQFGRVSGCSYGYFDKFCDWWI